MIQRILFEFDLLWAKLIRWIMMQDAIIILGLVILIILILYLILMVTSELTKKG